MKTKLQILIGIAVLGLAMVAKAQDFQKAASDLWNSSLGSTNMTYGVDFERGVTGDANKATFFGLFNANKNIAAGGGIAHEWSPNNSSVGADYTLSIGVQFSVAIEPLSNFGITNVVLHPFAANFVGTPFHGDNSGNLMNAARVGAYINIWEWQLARNPLSLNAGGHYGNETGTGYYARNYAGGFLSVSWGAIGGAQTASRAGEAWTTTAMRETKMGF